MRTANQSTTMRNGQPRRARRFQTSMLVSVAVHVVLGIVVWRAVQVPAVYERFMRWSRTRAPAPEQIEFVVVAPPDTSSVAGGRGPAVPSPARAQRAEPGPALVAPPAVPTALPPVPSEPVPEPSARGGGTSGAATGPLRGGNGPTRGIQPTYEDPRVWASDPTFVYAPKTDKERLDSALIATLGRYVDSVAANTYAPNKFERGDWTFGREGSKWGIDQQYIRLGRFSIPTALLALLPLNQMQPNPIAMERARNSAWMRADIMYHAQASMNEEQFRQAVRAIRDRKERERRQATRVPPTNPGPISSPGERPPPR